jgi:hypothetical protein
MYFTRFDFSLKFLEIKINGTNFLYRGSFDPLRLTEGALGHMGSHAGQVDLVGWGNA